MRVASKEKKNADGGFLLKFVLAFRKITCIMVIVECAPDGIFIQVSSFITERRYGTFW